MTGDSVEYVPFDRAVGFYEDTRAIPSEQLQRACELMRDRSAVTPTDPFLDAGAGTGRFARHLLHAGVRVTPVDISLPMLHRAREIEPGLPVGRADLRQLPFASGTFRAALLVHILHLVADWQAVLAEVRRTLADDAPLFLGKETGKRYRVRQVYHEIAAEYGCRERRIGAASIDVALERLTATGASIQRVDGGAIKWPATIAVAEQARVLRVNPFSTLWHVPPATHTAVCDELDRRLTKLFPNPDAAETVVVEFQLWEARWK